MGGFRIFLIIVGILIVSSLVHKMNFPMPKRKAKIIKTVSFFKGIAWIALDLSLFSELWNPITITIDVVSVIVIIALMILPMFMIKHYLKQLNHIDGNPLSKASKENLDTLNQAVRQGDSVKIQQIFHNSMLKNKNNRQAYNTTLTVLGKCIGETPDNIEGAVQDAFNHNPDRLKQIDKKLADYDREHPDNTISKHIINYAKKQAEEKKQNDDDNNKD